MARVLTVDDDDGIRGLIELNLQLEGHEVITAPDGEKALQIIKSQDLDLILLDVMMPVKSGWEVAEELKQDPRWNSVPVVFLTARAMEADVRKGTDIGVDAYVTKPFDPIDLMELVNRLISERLN